MTAPHEQPQRNDQPKTAWVREPQQQKTETKHAPAPDDNQAREEPGYGHGV
jgi:hypothetical protein